MGCRLSFTIMAASLAVVTPRVQAINNDLMATCIGHFTAGGSIKFRDNRWVPPVTLGEKRLEQNRTVWKTGGVHDLFRAAQSAYRGRNRF
ncbi:hypothetical protein TNCV_104111 [Trichonephila clavipes]|nr:hypothetical protein TNCV_104111 [Trichonephila clavipes]